MENTQRYWLRGLVAGIVAYVLFLLIFIGYIGEASTYFLPTIAPGILPIIPIGLLVGWMYGKMPKLAILLSIVFVLVLVGLEISLFKTTMRFITEKVLQNQIDNKMFEFTVTK